MIYNTEQSKKV